MKASLELVEKRAQANNQMMSGVLVALENVVETVCSQCCADDFDVSEDHDDAAGIPRAIYIGLAPSLAEEAV